MENGGSSHWYAGGLAKADSVQRLNADGVTKGSFIVRDSSTGSYSIDIAVNPGHEGGIKHVLIKSDGCWYWISQTKKFETIPELIAHYHTHSMHEHFVDVPGWSSVTLSTPMGTTTFVPR